MTKLMDDDQKVENKKDLNGNEDVVWNLREHVGVKTLADVFLRSKGGSVENPPCAHARTDPVRMRGRSNAGVLVEEI